jgi:phosphoglycerate kinase
LNLINFDLPNLDLSNLNLLSKNPILKKTNKKHKRDKIMDKLSIEDLDLKNKKVLMRVDFNVPLDENAKIVDDTRIKAALKSINYVLDQGGSLILMSHLGRPKGKKDPKFSLKPVSDRLSKLLNKKVIFANDCIGSEVEKLAANLKQGEILLLENLRFYEAEEKPGLDPSFAKKIASLGDVFINDAFGTAHRKHSSTYEITKFFPKNSAAGFLMEKEIEFLGGLLKKPKKPFYAIIGGKKISTKIKIIENLSKKVDGIFIGGAMAFTFFKALGYEIGDSLVEIDQIDNAKKIMQHCKENNVLLKLPEDIVIADNFSNNAKIKTIFPKDGIEKGFTGMDAGPKTIESWKNLLKEAKTIFWNGPLGVFEFPNFAIATNAIANILKDLDATTVIGGGDSLSAINNLGIGEKFTHLSTGGGASLEYLENGSLPAIEALSNN